MKTLNDIYIAEVKNLYALEKQSIEILEKINNQSIHNKKLSKRLSKLNKHATKQLNIVHSNLQRKNINPGNVIDSILQEIDDNLENLLQDELAPELKDVSLWTSLNRLLSYKISNYQNAIDLANQLDDNKTKKQLLKCLSSTQKDLKKIQGKIKKKILKKAATPVKT